MYKSAHRYALLIMMRSMWSKVGGEGSGWRRRGNEVTFVNFWNYQKLTIILRDLFFGTK